MRRALVLIGTLLSMAALLMPVSVSATTWIQGVQIATSDSNSDNMPDSAEVTVVVANDNLLGGAHTVIVEAKLFPPGKVADAASKEFIDSDKLSDSSPTPGGHVSFVLHLATTAASGIGSYTVLIMETDDDADGVQSANTTRSVTLYQLDLKSPVLLSVDKAEKVVGLGRQANYTFTISNQGPAADNFTVTVGTPPVEWTASSDKASVWVIAQSNGTFAVTVTAPANKVGVAPSIDLDITIESQATTLKWKSTIRATLGLADLRTSSADIGLSLADPEIGQSIEFRALVYNDGSVDAKNVEVRFSVSGDLEGSVTIPSLAAGGASVLVKQKWTAEPGQCMLVVSVDPDDKVLDLDHGNNIASAQFTVRAPDLVIGAPDLQIEPTVLVTDEDVVITATIHNNGTANASRVSVRMTIESFVRSQMIESISRDGGIATVTFIWNASAGIHNISIVIDPNNEMGEMNKMNNRVMKSLWVNQRPTAALNASSTRARTGDDITFTATGSRDPDGRVDRYFFDFGDGNKTDWSASKTASHTYAKAGVYTAKLWIKDNNGTVSLPATLAVTISKKPDTPRQPGFGLPLALGAAIIASAILSRRRPRQ